MSFQENISLKPFNSFGIDCLASFFVTVTTINELNEALDFAKERQLPFLIIGGGSNILFTKNYNGLVIQNKLTSIELINEDKDYFYIQASAGEEWHQFVEYCIQNNYAGVENLSLIPGSVGAAPMQNIGAYGVELKDVFFKLEALEISTRITKSFSLKDCEFGYRESVFKTSLKNQYIILNVTFKLAKQPKFNVEYGAIKTELEKMNCSELTAKNISQAVINIRTSKLPNPKEIGNAGSFFKNPIISEVLCSTLKKQNPEIPIYPSKNHQYKIAAGWLIEQCGWKGYRQNDYGCHAKQALVLVNYGNATGKEIYNLSTEIKQSVYEKFTVELEREVNII